MLNFSAIPKTSGKIFILRVCITHCMKTIYPDLPDGPEPPEETKLKVKIKFSGRFSIKIKRSIDLDIVDIDDIYPGSLTSNCELTFKQVIPEEYQSRVYMKLNTRCPQDCLA